MVWFSYHGGHSGQFCRHAKGELDGVVERAIAAGFSHYGLSEHVPRYRDEDLFPGEEDLGTAGLIAAFEAYTAHARALRERAQGRLDVLVGFESERLPPGDWAQRMRTLREHVAPDYIVGSVHDVQGHVIDFSADKTREVAELLGGVEAMQLAYFDALIDVIQTLRPEIVGHIDLIRKFDGPSASFAPHVMRRIDDVLEAVRSAGAVLDVNCATHRRGLGPVYPLPEILTRACAMGVGVTLGDDSHGAHDVGVGLDASMRAIATAGYREICYFAHGSAGGVEQRRARIEDVRPAAAV
ncbi:MAG TPA: histidinol-phosphatase [Polyangiales bacterium]|nr:histidinol-phosphatase [Polyangiales bacterium]